MTRCFWPPESDMPRSPTTVSKSTRHHRDIAVESGDVCGAARFRRSVVSVRPKAILRAMVSEKSIGSCGTIPMVLRNALERQFANVAAVEQDAARRSARSAARAA